jgi:REP element-mobilizing transposase RayT
MARPLRIEYPGAIYHVTSRGNEKRSIFLGDLDRKRFLNLLVDVNERYHWICHAYCLMENHYHLLIETPEGNLSIGMRQLNGVYTQAFNRRHGRVGHLFQGRFKAILVEKESYLLEASRYVVLNPVRAGAVEKPELWKWSSYRATGGMEKPHLCLTTEWILHQFGERRGKAEKKYRRFVRDGMREDSLWREVKAQSILGTEGFVERFIDYVRDHEAIPEIPKAQRYLTRPGLEQLFGERAFKDLRKRNERIEEAVEKYGYTQREVADHLGMYFTSISRIMRERKRMAIK